MTNVVNFMVPSPDVSLFNGPIGRKFAEDIRAHSQKKSFNFLPLREENQ